MAGIFDGFGGKYAAFANELRPIKKTPTGIFPVDLYTDGGVPEGQITLVAGKYHGGKTSMALKTVGQNQRKYPNKHSFWFDMEGAFDTAIDKALDHGVDLSRLTILRPDTGGEVTDLICDLIENNPSKVGMIVIDSVNDLINHKEFEKDADEHQIAFNASIVTKLLKRVKAKLNSKSFSEEERPTVLLISQIRANLGFGFKDYKIPGAKALEHEPALILVTNAGQTWEDKTNDELSLQQFKVTFDKVKVSSFNVKATEYIMCIGRNQTLSDGTPISTGFVDDINFVMSQAKSLELHNNGKSKQIFHTPELDQISFKSKDEITNFFYTNEEQYALLKARILAARRESKKILNNEVYMEYVHGNKDLFIPEGKSKKKETEKDEKSKEK